MQDAALVVVILACVAIIVLGSRFFLTPDRAISDFGVTADNSRALAAVKGIRDITSGVVILVVWAVADREALGWVFVTAALTPIGDAVVVLVNRGPLSKVIGVHGITAAVIVAAGLVLALG
jgi:hypothetical protein